MSTIKKVHIKSLEREYTYFKQGSLLLYTCKLNTNEQEDTAKVIAIANQKGGTGYAEKVVMQSYP